MTESSQFSIVNNSFSLSCNPFFEIWICKSLSVRIQHPAKNTNELGTAWQNIAGNRHIHEQKESHIIAPSTMPEEKWGTTRSLLLGLLLHIHCFGFFTCYVCVHIFFKTEKK